MQHRIAGIYDSTLLYTLCPDLSRQAQPIHRSRRSPATHAASWRFREFTSDETKRIGWLSAPLHRGEWAAAACAGKPRREGSRGQGRLKKATRRHMSQRSHAPAPAPTSTPTAPRRVRRAPPRREVRPCVR